MKRDVKLKKFYKVKSAIFFMFFLSILFLNFPQVYAQDEKTDEKVNKAYSCLEGKLETNCGDTKSTEQEAFSLLAISYNSSLQRDCKDSLISKKKENNCWPETGSSCDIKATSLAILALDRLEEEVNDSVQWLLTKRKIPKELLWFLEIDAENATSCKISVNEGSEQTFNIAENKKISGTSSCLSPAEQDYFLQINSNCYDDKFTISCNSNFKTTLIYKKPDFDIYHVSGLTNSGASGSYTEETINSFCFGLAGCDYEGSLWATFALSKTGEDISSYLPYLSQMSDKLENMKYLPSAFLSILASSGDYEAELINLRKQGKYWEETKGNKYYDTALGILALRDTTHEALETAKNYLLEIQDKTTGCWNNVKDTSFILYSGWEKEPSFEKIKGKDNITKSLSRCIDSNFYCVSIGKCSVTDLKDNLYCPGAKICCAQEPEEETCEEKNGAICKTNEVCTGDTTLIKGELCCLGACWEKPIEPEETECEEQGLTCRISCEEDEGIKEIYDCNAGDTCCAPKETPPTPGRNWTLIIILIILILLVILAIIFRNRLRLLMFRAKTGTKISEGPKPFFRPFFPPPTFPRMPAKPRQIIPRQAYQAQARRPGMQKQKSEKDKEFEDTMRKLKDMSG